VRYLKEIPLVNHVTINDLESVATAQARVNCEQNGVDMGRVTINTGDAVGLMYSRRQPLDNYDVIDLDPYGTVSPFLDSAVQAVADGGLLCITCTDMAVLCGSFPEKCFSLYGAVPLKNGYVHEAALRILLHAIEAAANKHKKHFCRLCLDYENKFISEHALFSFEELQIHKLEVTMQTSMSSGDGDGGGGGGGSSEGIHILCKLCDVLCYNEQHLISHSHEKHVNCSLCNDNGKHMCIHIHT
jgi:hypothetical protein